MLVTTVAVLSYIWYLIFLPNFPEGLLMDTMLKKVEKSRIRETLNLSTNADHRTNSIMFFFLVELREEVVGAQ